MFGSFDDELGVGNFEFLEVVAELEVELIVETLRSDPKENRELRAILCLRIRFREIPGVVSRRKFHPFTFGSVVVADSLLRFVA